MRLTNLNMSDQNVLPTGKVSKNNGNSTKPAVLQADHALGNFPSVSTYFVQARVSVKLNCDIPVST